MTKVFVEQPLALPGCAKYLGLTHIIYISCKCSVQYSLRYNVLYSAVLSTVQCTVLCTVQCTLQYTANNDKSLERTRLG